MGLNNQGWHNDGKEILLTPANGVVIYAGKSLALAGLLFEDDVKGGL